MACQVSDNSPGGPGLRDCNVRAAVQSFRFSLTSGKTSASSAAAARVRETTNPSPESVPEQEGKAAALAALVPRPYSRKSLNPSPSESAPGFPAKTVASLVPGVPPLDDPGRHETALEGSAPADISTSEAPCPSVPPGHGAVS